MKARLLSECPAPTTLETPLAEDRPLFVARPEDVATLNAHWQAAAGGSARFVRLSAPFGGGRRALAAEFLRSLPAAGEAPLIWRVSASDQENGVGWLMRMYGALVAAIVAEPARRGQIELHLNAQLPAQKPRVQGWYQQFVGALKESKLDTASGQVQLRIPQDNPLIGLIEITLGIARRVPVVLELQGAYVVHSVILAQFLEVLQAGAAATGAKLLVLIHDEPAGALRDSSHPAPLLDVYARNADAFPEAPLAAWGEAEVGAFLDSKGWSGNAARLAEIGEGRPGFIAEVAEILHEQGTLNTDLADVTISSLTPLTVDEDELDVPAEPAAEGQRKHAGAGDALQVAYLAALLGQIFPAALIAEMGGFERESIDDLLDAMEDLFEEVQYAEQMGTWLYRFKRGTFREGVLARFDNPEGKAIARRVATFMERFLAPRGQSFMIRATRLYAEADDFDRAAMMRAITLTNDSPDAWGMSWDLMRYDASFAWTDTMRRTVLTTLLEHLVNAGPLQQADAVHQDATGWATAKADRDLQGWLLLSGSKLDLRRGDLYRARDRARDALTVFTTLGNVQRQAEVHAHLAAIDLQDGKPDDALTAVEQSLEIGARPGEDGRKIVQPAILAQAELTRGVVARQKREFDKAIGHFRNANEVAGNTGLAALALESGIALGETYLASNQHEAARDILRRVLTATRQVGATQRERTASQLLAQAEGALRNFEGALQLAQRALQITQQLKLEPAMPVDLYNVGFFSLAMNKGADALPFFEQALARLKGQDNHPLLKDLYYYAGVASVQAGKADNARTYLQRAIRPLQAAREVRKLLTTLDQLALLEHRAGNTSTAVKLLNDAINIARDADLKDEKRELKKHLEQITGQT